MARSQEWIQRLLEELAKAIKEIVQTMYKDMEPYHRLHRKKSRTAADSMSLANFIHCDQNLSKSLVKGLTILQKQVTKATEESRGKRLAYLSQIQTLQTLVYKEISRFSQRNSEGAISEQSRIRDALDRLRAEGQDCRILGQGEKFFQATLWLSTSAYIYRIAGSENELVQIRSELASAHRAYSWRLKLELKPQQALIECLKAIQIQSELGEESELAGSFNNCGQIYHDLNEFDSAIGQFERSLLIRRKLNELELVARVLNNMGLTLKRVDLDAAVEAFKESVDLRREQKSNLLEGTLNNLIGALEMAGRRSEIDRYQQEVNHLRYNRKSS